jgi:hypothetical protein
MKTLSAIATALIVALSTVGCEPKAATSKKTETTTKTPGGETKTTVEQKTEQTPDGTTRTTTEKVEKSGENPPPARP